MAINIQTVEFPPSAHALPVIRQSLPDSRAFSKISASLDLPPKPPTVPLVT